MAETEHLLTADGEEIERLRRLRGMSKEELADKTGLSTRTVERRIKGGRGYVGTFKSLADALDVPIHQIVNDDSMKPKVDAPPMTERFRYGMTIEGSFESDTQRGHIVQLTPEIIAGLRRAGISVADVEADSTVSSRFVSGIRLLSCVWLLTKGKGKAWCIVAVRKDRFADFVIDSHTDKLRNDKLSTYGEIVVSGDGLYPPDDVIAKVAKLYRCDAEALLLQFQLNRRPDDPEAQRRADA